MKKKFGPLSVITLFALALTFASCKRKDEPPPPPPASAPAPEPTPPPPASDAKPDIPAPDKVPSTKKGGAEG